MAKAAEEELMLLLLAEGLEWVKMADQVTSKYSVSKTSNRNHPRWYDLMLTFPHLGNAFLWRLRRVGRLRDLISERPRG